MQKNCYWLPVPFGAVTFDRLRNEGSLHLIVKVMKLTFALVTITFLSAQATGVAQNVTISGKHLTLQQIFAAIEKQTEYVLFNNKRDLAGTKKISFSASSMPLEELLDAVFRDQPLKYSIKGNMIVVSRKNEPASLPQIVFTGQPDPPVRVRVADIEGRPLPGASVINKNAKSSGVTDAEGALTLNLSVGDVIEISFIGYEKQSVTIKDVSAPLNVVLKPSASDLDAVTVNAGYWRTSAKRSTGNIVRITAKDIEGQPVTSPLVALQGRVPGLNIILRDGAPNTAPQIRIRGNNSLRQRGGYPLYIIDGVVVDSRPLESNISQYRSNIDPLAGINPENIESIDVLKDADATAIYGSRGANGVILITTKQRRDNLPTSVEARVYRGIGEIPRFIDMLNTQQFLEMRKEAFRNANMQPGIFDYDMIYWDSTKYTDWQKVLLGGSAKVSDAELAFSGGNDRTSFRVNGGYHKETNIISDDFGFDRWSAGFNVSHRSADNRFSILANTNYGFDRNRNLNTSGFLQAAYVLAPNTPDLYHEDGSLNWGLIYLPDYNYTATSILNPMAELRRSNEVNSGILVANASLSYLLVKGLTLKTNLGYTSTNSDERTKNPIAALSPGDIYYGSTGRASFSSNKRKSVIIEPQAAYDFKLNDHEFNLVAGATFNQNKDHFNSVTAYGYTSDVLLNTLQGAEYYSYSNDNPSEYRYIAGYARIGYNWREKYLVNLTGRRDGSSRFGPGKQFGNFGAIGAAWIFSSEGFMTGTSDILSFGKLRGSYGITGNDQIGEYQFYDLYRLSRKYMRTITLVPKGLFNPDFNWEVTRKMELAVELGFLKDRLTAQAAWFRNTSSNQVVDNPLSYITGFGSIYRNFDEATIENTGWEFALQSHNINRRHFKWETSLNITLSRNRLLSFDGIESSPYATQYKVGESLNIERKYVWKGVDPVTGNHVIADLDGNGSIDDADRVFSDNMDPKYFGGISNTFSYKGIGLSFLFRFANQKGTTAFQQAPGGGANQPVEVMKRWRKQGDVTDIAKFSMDYQDLSWFYYSTASDHGIVDASFLTLSTLSLSYNLPRELVQKAKIREASIYVHGQNLLTITKFIGLSPESGAYSMPQLRMITGGINLKF